MFTVFTKVIPNFSGLILFVDGAHGAVSGTLTTLDTGTLSQKNVSGGSDTGMVPSVEEFQSPNVLKLLTDQGASAARNTFCGVQDDGGSRIVHRELFYSVFKGNVPDSELGAHGLEFTSLVSRTPQTFVRVVGHNEFQHRPAGFHDLRIMGDIVQTFHHGSGTGPDNLGLAFRPNDTQSTGTPGFQVRVSTEGGHLDLSLLGSGKDRGSFGNAHGHAVYFTINRLHYPSPS